MRDFLDRYFAYIPDGSPEQTGLLSVGHLGWMAVVIAACVVVPLVFRHTSQRAKNIFLYTVAGILLVNEGMRTYWLFRTGEAKFQNVAPLDLCGFMIYLTIVTIFVRKRFLMNICYAIAFTGPVFGVLTPSINQYPWWGFNYVHGMVGHGLICLVALFFIVAEGFRPELKYVPRILGIVVAVALVVIAPLDYFFDANWFYLRSAPAGTPLEIYEEWVGWPWYFALILATAAVLWTLLYLPFVRRKAHQRSSEPEEESQMP
ncbi:MAG: TIGR02206 family membrane protein [Propionibacteriaceae bacterium]|jgi:hypothetical integral membrane protein (TIGR02206 family)|nr:TIGR02206 family membrane protein [Propionibacteriaceae bacterium]